MNVPTVRLLVEYLFQKGRIFKWPNRYCAYVC
jgi:hypothetical protein